MMIAGTTGIIVISFFFGVSDRFHTKPGTSRLPLEFVLVDVVTINCLHNISNIEHQKDAKILRCFVLERAGVVLRPK